MQKDTLLSSLNANSDKFRKATFEVSLNLPNDRIDETANAGEAVRREYSASCKWKRLRCREVSLVAKTETGSVFEVRTGATIEFDWTWEGSFAFRPAEMRNFEDDVANGSFETEVDGDDVWRGELLEVDESAGRLFVLVQDSNNPPRRGSFYVRPFEYLAWLDRIYNAEEFEAARSNLGGRLSATLGGTHPNVTSPIEVGIPRMLDWWQKSWSVLWGPPGTGKTYTLGHQVAGVMADPTERVLVVSTTNKATDAAAISFGKAAYETGLLLESGLGRRIGKTANLSTFREENLLELLRGTETQVLSTLEEQTQKLKRARNSEEKALIRKRIKELRQDMRDASLRNFLDASVRVVISTSFKATMLLADDEVRGLIEQGQAPFTTVFIDEAGLVSRAASAALSLLSARRVVLVGDPKQLAPISRLSRILEPSKAKWLGRSALSHLEDVNKRVQGVHLLSEQYRMHPDICEVVSKFHYDGVLKTASPVLDRKETLPKVLKDAPKAIWWVLDEQITDHPSIRANRGPGGRSWIRKSTIPLLERLFSDASMQCASGLFISPYRAQARLVADWFAKHEYNSWNASTVHSQQGTEAEIVLFDTVNAGSYGWPYDEWKRLVNVALSRARQSVVVFASCAEMQEPYLRPLLATLSPRVLHNNRGNLTWIEKKLNTTPEELVNPSDCDSHLLGNQISLRKQLRPILSHDQQRLCSLKLDGKPRLVRGVAGSGKTVVLANWLMQTVRRLSSKSESRVWAVFANRSLQSMIASSIESAWSDADSDKAFPWDSVSLHHVHELLDILLPEAGLSPREFGYDYDSAAASYLQRLTPGKIKPLCDAMFLDEAQDMGPNLIRLLSMLVKQSDPSDKTSRAVNIFYDNAQNIYGRPTPKWSDIGIDLRGRSTVMKESFRSTKPITEFALNVLYRFQPPGNDPEHKELVRRSLIERSTLHDEEWWDVRFTQIDGPKPTFLQYDNLDEEIAGLSGYLGMLIEEQGVRPSDICLLYNGKNIAHRLEKIIAPKLEKLGISLSVQTNKPFQRDERTVIASTSHSFKGYDSEIVIIVGIDQYKAKESGILANNLYVAMTRARSVLTMFGQTMQNKESQEIYMVVRECLDNLDKTFLIEKPTSAQDDVSDLLNSIGWEHRNWLTSLWKSGGLKQEPLINDKSVLVADPLFTLHRNGLVYACFGKNTPNEELLSDLRSMGVINLNPGEQLG